MVQQWWQWFIFPSLSSYLPHGQPLSYIPCLPGVLLIDPGENNRDGETLTIKNHSMQVDQDAQQHREPRHLKGRSL
jgi:hypothetical protein